MAKNKREMTAWATPSVDRKFPILVRPNKFVDIMKEKKLLFSMPNLKRKRNIDTHQVNDLF